MTAEQYLRQLKNIRKRITNKRRDAVMWRDIAENMGGSIGEADKVQKTQTQSRMADAIGKAIDYERDADMLAEKLVDLQYTIICQIDGMGNTDEGLILSELYVHGISMTQISHEWNCTYRHLERVKKRALHIFTEKYGRNFKKNL